ncbi:FAD-binding domain-containing protein [Xylariomycetidae sp. FL0641]|nr:FAD-binding domain-containing protein [Xylariomycetidae sp. FL0641]
MAAPSAIDTLQKLFPADQLCLRGADGFDDLNASHLSALENEIAPAAILLPKSSHDVSTFLKAIKPFVERHEATFAIRGAGQQPLPGCANIQDGIKLDLRLITGVDLDMSKGIVSIGAGERWGAVYEKLHEHNLGVTGSRSAKGGIGGLALSGGLSFFSSREGLICDNVVCYEIVLASGDIVECNADKHADLWRALRGGGNNLGVVTRYHLRTFEQGPFWGGSVFYPSSSVPSQIESLVQHLQAPDEEAHIMISLFFAAQFGQLMGLNQAYYTREVAKPPVLEPFTAMQPQMQELNSTRMINLRDAAAEQASMAMDGVRCAYMNTTVKADVQTLQAAADAFTSTLEPLKALDGLVFSFTLQPYPVSLLEKCVTGGGNATGLDASGGPLVSILLLMYWKNKDDDAKLLGAAKELLGSIDRDAASRGQAVAYKYMNYAFSFQDPISSYGAENKKALVEVSKKYDPEGIFQIGVPGGFKLSV